MALNIENAEESNNIFLFSVNKDGLKKLDVDITVNYRNKIHLYKNNPNIFLCDIFHYDIKEYTNEDGTVRKTKGAYWEYINKMIPEIPLSNSKMISKFNLHLILHIGDDNSSLDTIGSTSFWKDTSFNTEITPNNKNFNKDQIKSSDFNLQTVWGFHHTPALGIFGKIIMFDDQKKDENVLKDSPKLLDKLLEIYEDNNLSYVIIKDYKSEYYGLKDGNRKKRKDIEVPDYIKKLKLLKECETELLRYYNDEKFLTIFTNENFLKDRDFYICLANLQLCGCNTANYGNFYEEIINNSIKKLSYIDAPRSLNPKFNNNDFGEGIKPIIIYGTKPLSDLQKGYDRRINYLDSSIWLQYVYDDKTFNEAKKNIKEWEKLYETNNAREIAEFRARQLKNSFLREFDENASHANNVAPFIFHSEAKMKKRAGSELEELNEKGNLQWRFLIVDDHATERSTEGKIVIIPKCEIVRKILGDSDFVCKCCKNGKDFKALCPKAFEHEEKSKNSGNICNKHTIHLDCSAENTEKTILNIEETLSKIEKTKYDFILLDYLLGKKDGTEGESREYAHEFLNRIKTKIEGDKNKWEKIAGPNGSFRFFFISAFTNAVNEQMLAEGLDFHEPYWHISRGACPTTTPYLFLYYLLKSMNAQIELLGTNYKFKEQDNKQDDNKNKIYSLCEFLNEIYNSDQPRREAINNFNNLLKLRVKYGNLKYDTICRPDENERYPSDKSELILSLFPDINFFYDDAFWEHTMHLVYLTAFGTIRQWHDMWEEFMLIRPYLQKVKTDKEVENGDIAKAVIKGIKKYITSLQNQSR